MATNRAPDLSIEVSEDVKPVEKAQQAASRTIGYFAMVANGLSAVIMIAANKQLFRSGFNFVATLTWIHFLITAAVLHVMLRFKFFEYKQLPWKEVAKVSSICTMSIVFMNLSLKYNTIGVYQLSKLLSIPLMVTIEYLFYDKVFSTQTLYALAILVIGVAISTVREVSLTPFGTVLIIIAVISQSIGQILVGTKQKELQASPTLLVFYQMHFNALFILPIIPFTDNLSPDSPGNLWQLQWTYNITTAALGSCAIAAILNVSSFFVVGIFSPVTYSVVGHAKTISVILIGVVFFGESATITVVIGVLVAIGGVWWYSTLK
ncbi:Nucleotide/sugar transporter family protein [Planoprotostelium fungivorum]|uniref:Nucleotide/sugar transporter family protein n=1 Tax=Planoprotostelium fungivorum TaxID=1890364 RepID=A0A2P6NPB1_9EUKA|nr:Nucleotide/sugar transporter family protein [Planoprotostelium fungivorum]